MQLQSKLHTQHLSTCKKSFSSSDIAPLWASNWGNPNEMQHGFNDPKSLWVHEDISENGTVHKKQLHDWTTRWQKTTTDHYLAAEPAWQSGTNRTICWYFSEGSHPAALWLPWTPPNPLYTRNHTSPAGQCWLCKIYCTWWQIINTTRSQISMWVPDVMLAFTKIQLHFILLSLRLHSLHKSEKIKLVILLQDICP